MRAAMLCAFTFYLDQATYACLGFRVERTAAL